MPHKIKTFKDIIPEHFTNQGFPDNRQNSFMLTFDKFKDQPITRYNDFFRCLLVSLLERENFITGLISDDDLHSLINYFPGILPTMFRLYEYSKRDIQSDDNDFLYINDDNIRHVTGHGGNGILQIATVYNETKQKHQLTILTPSDLRKLIRDNL